MRLVFVAIALALGFAHPARAQGDDLVYVVTYIEAVPSATPQALELLSAYAEQSRRADGNVQFQALQRIGRPNHFALVEAWTDALAHEARARSPDAERFRAELTPLLYSPPDQRTQRSLATGPSRDAGRGAIYVLTHVDVLPSSLDQVVGYLSVLAQDSRREAGNLRFDVLVTERRNHMTIVEAWKDAGAQAAHLGEPHNRAFRTKLAPAQGALYDERLYRAL